MTWSGSNSLILSASVHTGPGRHSGVIREGQSELQPDLAVPAARKGAQRDQTHKPTVTHEQFSTKTWQHQLLPLTKGTGPGFPVGIPIQGRAEPLSSQHCLWQRILLLPVKGLRVSCREVRSRSQRWEDVGVRMGVQTLSWGGTWNSRGARWGEDLDSPRILMEKLGISGGFDGLLMEELGIPGGFAVILMEKPRIPFGFARILTEELRILHWAWNWGNI